MASYDVANNILPGPRERVRAWHQLSQADNPESAPLVFVGIMDAPVSVLEFEPIVTSMEARPRWDGFCSSGRSVHRYNEDCATSEVVFKVGTLLLDCSCMIILDPHSWSECSEKGPILACLNKCLRVILGGLTRARATTGVLVHGSALDACMVTRPDISVPAWSPDLNPKHVHGPCDTRVLLLAPRDQQIISARRKLPNGGYLFASTSLPNSIAPPPRAVGTHG
jgi:hypothetical protein